jgi:hypothetical protein
MTLATDDARKWAWIAPDGTDGSGPGSELVAGLKSGALPPATLVWCATWLEWLPASRVGFLASALPQGKAEPPQEPKRAPTALSPPPRPPGAPPPAPMKLPRPPGVKLEGAPGANPSSFGVLGKPRGASVLGPRGPQAGSELPRAPQPTLAEEEGGATRTTTLRPPGAVPPPPRGGPAMGGVGARPPARLEEEQPTVRKPPPLGLGGAGPSRDTLPEITERAPGPPPPTTAGINPRPNVLLPGAPTAVSIQSVPSEGALTKPAPKGYQAAVAAAAPMLGAGPFAPVPPGPAAPLTADLDQTLGSTPFEVPVSVDAGPPSTTLESAPPPPTEVKREAPVRVTSDALEDERPSRPLVPRAAVIGLAVLAGVVLVLAVGVVVLVVTRLQKEPGAVSAAGAVSAVASAAPKVPGCELHAPAARLSIAVHRSVPPAFAELDPSGTVAVGIAETSKNAAGLVIALDTLDVKRPFEDAGTEALYGVVPFAAGNAPSFSVDRAGGALHGARTVAPDLAIGVAGVDLVRTQGGATTVVFPHAASDKITDPRIATTASGHLVTLRRGGLSGKVLYGWLASDGTPKGDLVTLEVPGITMSGTPDAAANDKGGLIAFAGRPSAEVPWRVQLAAVSPGAAAVPKSFETPPGGAGGGSIAPSVGRLGSGGWILQWTEGATGQYQVRVQSLSSDLSPVGEARLVSPKGANAGQGAVFAVGNKVLSIFVQTTAGHDELWGATLRCD